jgi:hypothetical protein
MREGAEMKFKGGISESTGRDVLYRPDPGPGPIPEPDPPDPSPDPFPTPPIPPEPPVSGAHFDHSPEDFMSLDGICVAFSRASVTVRPEAKGGNHEKRHCIGHSDHSVGISRYYIAGLLRG